MHEQEKTYLAIRMELKIIKTETTHGENENEIDREQMSEKRSMILPNGLEQNTERQKPNTTRARCPRKSIQFAQILLK